MKQLLRHLPQFADIQLAGREAVALFQYRRRGPDDAPRDACHHLSMPLVKLRILDVIRRKRRDDAKERLIADHPQIVQQLHRPVFLLLLSEVLLRPVDHAIKNDVIPHPFLQVTHQPPVQHAIVIAELLQLLQPLFRQDEPDLHQEFIGVNNDVRQRDVHRKFALPPALPEGEVAAHLRH